jgi:hypothetical protein
LFSRSPPNNFLLPFRSSSSTFIRLSLSSCVLWNREMWSFATRLLRLGRLFCDEQDGISRISRVYCLEKVQQGLKSASPYPECDNLSHLVSDAPVSTLFSLGQRWGLHGVAIFGMWRMQDAPTLVSGGPSLFRLAKTLVQDRDTGVSYLIRTTLRCTSGA